MKVTLTRGLKGYTGELDGAVYYYHSRLGKTLMRRKPVKVTTGAQQEKIGSVAKALKAIEPSAGFRSDLRTYLRLLRDQDGLQSCLSWNNLFIRMMWAMAKQIPEIDLKQIDREMILEQDLPCQSVKRAVAAGLLPYVPGTELLDRSI